MQQFIFFHPGFCERSVLITITLRGTNGLLKAGNAGTDWSCVTLLLSSNTSTLLYRWPWSVHHKNGLEKKKKVLNETEGLRIKDVESGKWVIWPKMNFIHTCTHAALFLSLCRVNGNSTQLCFCKGINTIRKGTGFKQTFYFAWGGGGGWLLLSVAPWIKIIIWTGHNYSHWKTEQAWPLFFSVDF